MKIKLALIASIGCSISSPAYAKPVSGARVELIGGYDSSSLKVVPTPPVSVGPPLVSPGLATPAPYSLHASGVTYGAIVGYDIPVTNTVSIGLDAEISGSSADITNKTQSQTFTVFAFVPFGPPLTPSNIVGYETLSIKRDLYVGGRVTIPVTNRLNAYAKVGYTNLRLKYTLALSQVSFSGVVLATSSGSATSNLDGVRLGVGAQAPLTKTIFTSLEYRYSNYENNFSRNQVAATVGLRF